MSARLDLTMVALGLARSRTHAQAAIRAGQVRVAGQVVTRPAQPVEGPEIEVANQDRFVSRAAHKLLGALAVAPITVPSRVLDAGASTGGFTQVLLEAGAGRVYAVDVGHGQLAPGLRSDPRVVVRERLNLRNLTLTDLESEPVGLVVGDVSFISLTLLLEPLFAVLAPGGSALLLVKPQFEVGRRGLDDHGLVRSPELRREAVDRVIATGAALGWRAAWQAESRLPGESGNREYFVNFVGADVGGGG